MKENIYLRKIRKRDGEWNTGKYPFSIPVIKDFTEFRFDKSVTYIVGGKESGKSTLLEAIAVLLRINPEGGSRHFNFHTEETHSSLHAALIASQASLSYRDTYFFRAESYYNVISEINRRGLNEYYGQLNFHEFSHGENFMALLEHRLTGKGIYIFDEPEAALSFQNQLQFLLWIKDVVKKGAQIIIATHSPVILSYPNASILEIKEGRLVPMRYCDCSVYRDFYGFLLNREGCLQELGLIEDDGY
ncbi:MAG: AAA family ATPase [Muribaculaceae bacterium]|nr:AAA family ATPase [Muribaculaceae bacterium]